MVSVSLDSGSSYSCSDLYPTTNNNIVVGLNGALQKRFILPNKQGLVPGNVHRATHVDFGVGGKGQDVAIALQCLLGRGRLSDNDKTNDDDDNDDNDDNDADATTTTTSSSNNIRLVQFIGTDSAGETVHNLLKDRLGENTMEFTVRSSSKMRTCTSIISADETTELVEPSGSITSDELEELFSVLPSKRDSQIECGKNGTARSLCIMGTMPPGCPEDTYARIYTQIAGPNTVCVVDSLAGTRPLLQTVSKMGHGNEKIGNAGPLLFKINASELCKLAGTSKSNSETGGITVSELTNAIEGFLTEHLISLNNNDSSTGVIGLAITDGKHDAYFVSIRNNNSQEEQASSLPSFRVFKLPVPNLDDESSRTLYPIGAGDAVAAGTIGAWTSLTANDVTATSSSSFPSVIPEESLASLVNFVESILDRCSKGSFELTTVQAQAVAAFAFGLACGSASCLQEQNSVLDASDANTLFQAIILCPPEIISNTR